MCSKLGLSNIYAHLEVKCQKSYQQLFPKVQFSVFLLLLWLPVWMLCTLILKKKTLVFFSHSTKEKKKKQKKKDKERTKEISTNQEKKKNCNLAQACRQSWVENLNFQQNCERFNDAFQIVSKLPLSFVRDFSFAFVLLLTHVLFLLVVVIYLKIAHLSCSFKF